MTDTSAAPFNTVTWWEIPVQDLEKAKAFYGAVFGWTIEPFGEGFVGAFADGAMIGGLAEAADGEVAEGVRIYVNVADLEATIAAAAANGGAEKTARQEVGGDMGWWANVTDPQGRVIGLATMIPAT